MLRVLFVQTSWSYIQMRILALQIPLRRELIPITVMHWIEVSDRATLGSSCIITMLPSSPQVKHVYSKIIPVLQKLDAGLTSETLFIDSTTLDVNVAREVASSVVNTGAQMVDAPVSGGTQFVLEYWANPMSFVQVYLGPWPANCRSSLAVPKKISSSHSPFCPSWVNA